MNAIFEEKLKKMNVRIKYFFFFIYKKCTRMWLKIPVFEQKM